MEKKTQECLNNICIRFPTYENECYAKRTRILHTMKFLSILKKVSILVEYVFYTYFMVSILQQW